MSDREKTSAKNNNMLCVVLLLSNMVWIACYLQKKSIKMFLLFCAAAVAAAWCVVCWSIWIIIIFGQRRIAIGQINRCVSAFATLANDSNRIYVYAVCICAGANASASQVHHLFVCMNNWTCHQFPIAHVNSHLFHSFRLFFRRCVVVARLHSKVIFCYVREKKLKWTY